MWADPVGVHECSMKYHGIVTTFTLPLVFYSMNVPFRLDPSVQSSGRTSQLLWGRKCDKNMNCVQEHLHNLKMPTDSLVRFSIKFWFWQTGGDHKIKGGKGNEKTSAMRSKICPAVHEKIVLNGRLATFKWSQAFDFFPLLSTCSHNFLSTLCI